MPVYYNNADIIYKLPQKRKISSLIKFIFFEEKQPLGTLAYTFCSDEFLLEMNKKFLKHDYYTDILTFDVSDNKSISGDVYISIERVKENAFANSVTFIEEIQRVIFHGALHLCGYKDKSKNEKRNMRKREDYYLNAFKTFHVENNTRVSRETE